MQTFFASTHTPCSPLKMELFCSSELKIPLSVYLRNGYMEKYS